MPRRVRLIIDTDPGIDDAMAIACAAGLPEVELVGLTTVFGNVLTPEATRNALSLAERFGLEVPVAEGAEAPLEGETPYPPRHIHGDAGLGDLPAPEPAGAALGETAAMFMVRQAQETPGEVMICAIGPLTNVASALRLDPSFAANVAGIVVMGGSIDAGGNITDHAEANIYHDPLAAAEVLASTAPVTLIGLDVTHSVIMSGSEFSTLARKSEAAGGFLQEISRFYLKFAESRGRFDGCAMHDPTAVIACTHPELFDLRQSPIRVVLEGDAVGQTVADAYVQQPYQNMAMGVRSEDVKAVFSRAIERLP